jgi:hypothetical protein
MNILFPLGHLVATPRALEIMQAAGIDPSSLLARHATGDWGDVDAHDKQANDLALRDGNRLFSAYGRRDRALWVITEADRSVTTILRPEDY